MRVPAPGCGAARYRPRATDATPSPTGSKERSTSHLRRPPVRVVHTPAPTCPDPDGPDGLRGRARCASRPRPTPRPGSGSPRPASSATPARAHPGSTATPATAPSSSSSPAKPLAPRPNLSEQPGAPQLQLRLVGPLNGRVAQPRSEGDRLSTPLPHGHRPPGSGSATRHQVDQLGRDDHHPGHRPLPQRGADLLRRHGQLAQLVLGGVGGDLDAVADLAVDLEDAGGSLLADQVGVELWAG